MKYLTINGEKKQIPGFPHHKEFVYRLSYFFEARSLSSLLFINGVYKTLRRRYFQWKYDIAIPLILLIDPTAACNLKCRGCWAADYDRNKEISYDKLDEVLTDARKLGVSEIIFSGGEPMMRKDDILKLCRKHNNFPFAMFTNGTLIDDAFAGEMASLKNLNAFVSIEGFKDATDFRRGTGTFDRVIAAMDILKKHDIGFGFSVCYHSKNYKEICSDEFLDYMREKGAWVAWMFNYMPLGSGADLSLCLNAEQRNTVRQKVEAYRKKYDYTIIDFANIGHLAFGCVAAGNEFVHINAHGDMEPCAFFHYADSDIHNKSFREALASPFFRHFRKAKPFDGNTHRPCPIMDVPEALQRLSEAKGVCSTHIRNPESMQQLAKKTMHIAEEWKPRADSFFANMTKKEKRKVKTFKRYLLYKE
ncbi:MAG: radical SAM protein [Bacteroidales bacterium]|nr:radical SAM protein [Bacteroidales bacterium]